MKFKKTLSAALLAGSLALGTAGVASAAEEAPNRSRPTQEQICARAKAATERFEAGKARLADRVQKLTEKRAEAQAAGNTELVDRIDNHLARLKSIQERIEGRLQEIRTKTADRCQ